MNLRTLAAFLFLTGPVHASVTPVYQGFLDDTAAGKSPLLPNFGYAGYRHGEVPIPDVKGPIFDVTKYGAIPDDDQPDFEAIQKTIEACEAAGGGVVWIPKGVWLLNPSMEDATNARLRISKSRVVLRGAGSGPDGTIFWMPAEMKPENPKEMWTGRPVLSVSGGGAASSRPLGKVNGTVPMGSLRIPVQPGHELKVGMRIVLVHSVPGKETEELTRRIAPREWSTAWNSGIWLKERHEIREEGRDFIVLSEPVLISMEGTQLWTIAETSYLGEIGIEGICFRGNWHEAFRHHKDWRHDSAWRGIQMTGVENSWIRDCVFEDMNWPIQIKSSRQCTVENLAFTGKPGHFGIQATGTANILNLGVRDEAGHVHGPSLQSGSCGTVYHGCVWDRQGSFDSHASTPYANLFENGIGGVTLEGVGGAANNFPHHLHGLVLWNHEQTATYAHPVEFWSEVNRVRGYLYQTTFLQALLVGMHGVSLDFKQTFLNEGFGTVVKPGSLWLAQLERRLGKIPGHFRKYAEE